MSWWTLPVGRGIPPHRSEAKMYQQAGRVLVDPSDTIAPPSSDEVERLIRLAPEFGIEMQFPTH